MTTPLESLVAAGTKLWLDSVDPDLVRIEPWTWGPPGPPRIRSSSPTSSRRAASIGGIDELIRGGNDDEPDHTTLTDDLVKQAQEVLLPVWESTGGNDGYVSFELDPLLEDPQLGPPHAQRVARYIELGRQWSAGHRNRMIKVPATPAGLDAIEELCAAGVTLNITLVFSPRQYRIARDNMWRETQRRSSLLRIQERLQHLRLPAGCIH